MHDEAGPLASADEGGGLESHCGVYVTKGSNPLPSAIRNRLRLSPGPVCCLLFASVLYVVDGPRRTQGPAPKPAAEWPMARNSDHHAYVNGPICSQTTTRGRRLNRFNNHAGRVIDKWAEL